VVASAQTVTMTLTPYGTNLYVYIYLVSEGLSVCCYGLIVLELYSTALRDLAGLATVARLFIQGAMAASILLSLLLLTIEHTPRDALSIFYVFERTIVSSLLFLVLLITAFLVYYPAPLNRNFLVYSIGYAVYFLTVGCGLLVHNIAGAGWDRTLSAVLLSISSACLLFWTLALNRKGEEKKVVFGGKWNTKDEQKLLQQLQEINAGLLRAVKK
jgi:hypothetical protein